MTVAAVVDELNEIVRPDGAVLRIRESSTTALRLELDLSESSCPECVVPKDLMLEILVSRVALVDPDVRTIELDDPREPACLSRGRAAAGPRPRLHQASSTGVSSARSASCR